MRRFLPFGFILVGTVFFHGIALDARAADAPNPISIKVTLVPPRDIVVDWKNSATDAAGHIVEWGTKPDDEFVPLGFFPANHTSYRHPDLMWETTHYYRVRPYYGPATPDLEVSLPKDLSDDEYKQRYALPEVYQWAAPVIVPDPKPVEKKSIRNPATAAAAAPTNFKITLQPVAVAGFKLTWTDHASDEEGFMIEFKPEGETEFRVVALVEPNVNSFGWAFEPPTRKAIVRVRAFYYGKPSELLHQRTGLEPAEAATAAKPEPAPKRT